MSSAFHHPGFACCTCACALPLPPLARVPPVCFSSLEDRRAIGAVRRALRTRSRIQRVSSLNIMMRWRCLWECAVSTVRSFLRLELDGNGCPESFCSPVHQVWTVRVVRRGLLPGAAGHRPMTMAFRSQRSDRAARETRSTESSTWYLGLIPMTAG